MIDRSRQFETEIPLFAEQLFNGQTLYKSSLGNGGLFCIMPGRCQSWTDFRMVSGIGWRSRENPLCRVRLHIHANRAANTNGSPAPRSSNLFETSRDNCITRSVPKTLTFCGLNRFSGFTANGLVSGCTPTKWTAAMSTSSSPTWPLTEKSPPALRTRPCRPSCFCSRGCSSAGLPSTPCEPNSLTDSQLCSASTKFGACKCNGR